jgi:peroxiredoxin
MEEMPRLEKEIWQAFKGKDFTVLAIGREHSADELRSFRDKKRFTFPIAPDPERKIYSKYATMYIPRNIVIDENGNIVYQSKGYTAEEFENLLDTIKKALGH